jgi:hypothetical protein
MKTRNFLIIAALSSISLMSIGQKTTDTYQTDIDQVRVVVLHLDGQARITPVSGNQLWIESNLTTKGDVWGIKREKSRPAFEINGMLSSDTLYVSTPELFNYSSVGINTYSEKIESSIRIPGSVKVIIIHANKVEIEPGFTCLDIKNAKSVDMNDLTRDRIKSLCCVSKKDLTVNGKLRGDSYEFEGLGRESYYLNANDINLNIK